jgi:predicted AAA+ superfamily ATPase
LRVLADLARAADATRRRALAAEAQGLLGELEGSVALIAYEPGSVRPPGRWLALRGHIAGLLGRLAPPLLIQAGEADATDAARRLSALAGQQVEPLPMRTPGSPLDRIVQERLRDLENAMKEAAPAQA